MRLNSLCIERAHRIGPLQHDRKGSRPSIAKFVNYADTAQILQRFHNQRELMIEEHSLLLFADYSIEVSRKRKAICQICSALHEKQIKFFLAYPAILHLTSQSIKHHTFHDPSEAELLLNRLEKDEPSENASPLQQRIPRQPKRLNHQLMHIPQCFDSQRHRWTKSYFWQQGKMLSQLATFLMVTFSISGCFIASEGATCSQGKGLAITFWRPTVMCGYLIRQCLPTSTGLFGSHKRLRFLVLCVAI